MISKIECLSCRHQIDAEARLCPYCGADPRTGQRFDPKPLLEKHFPRREELSASERFLEFFRERQGFVVTGVIAVLFLIVVGLHRFITQRNLNQPDDVPAIPLTEIADLGNRAREVQSIPIPQLEFQYVGSPQRMKTLLIEPGAVAPPLPPDLTAENPILNRFIRPKPQPRPPEQIPTATAAPPEADTIIPPDATEPVEPEPEPEPETTTTTPPEPQ